MRSGPSLYYPAIGLLRRGQEVRLLGRNWSARWAKIDAPGNVRGWLLTRYIWSTVPLYQLPVSVEGLKAGRFSPKRSAEVDYILTSLTWK